MNSKRKGNKFERVVAKFFTDWSGFKFGRTPGSGSFHNNRDLGSDLICNDDKHKNKCCISIECKNYQDIRFEHVLLGNRGCKIFSFWEQASKDAQRTEKFPILCMRYNSMPRGEFFFVVSELIASSLLNVQDLSNSPINKVMVITAPELMKLNPPTVTLYIFMASDIKEKIDYQKFHKHLRKSVKNYYK